MRYLKKTPIDKLRSEYDIIAGWGTSPLEFDYRYSPVFYKLDCIINGEGKRIGENICGIDIVGKDCLLNEHDKKILFVLFTNIENVLLEQILSLYPNSDSIVSRLVDYSSKETSFGENMNYYSASGEDVMFMDIIKSLKWPKSFPYMDIGVCHPVVRNNTYMLYENGYENGLLIEPNKEYADLTREYRPNNTVLNVGAGYEEDGELPYVSRIDKTLAGLNHFLGEDEIVDYSTHEITNIPVKHIQSIIEENGGVCPYLLDLDIEGMEPEILEAIDLEKYPIKVICIEYRQSAMNRIKTYLKENDYVHIVSTRENGIYMRREDYNKL